jgi:hypothetical protein
MSKKIDLKVKPTDWNKIQSPPETKPYYPSLYIDKDLPLDDKVGKTVEARVTFKVASRTENKKGKNKSTCSYQLDVLDIDFEPEGNNHVSASPQIDRKMNY